MRRFLALLSFSLLAACSTAAPPASAPQASPRERAEVLASLQSFLDALRAQDTTVMLQHVDSLTRLTLLRPAPGGGTRVMVMTGEQFVRAVSRPGQPGIDEPIRNPVVHVSGDLASVWAEYQVRRDGGVSHCGFDAFHLSRRGGRWKLLNVSDTFQPTGCGPAWPR